MGAAKSQPLPAATRDSKNEVERFTAIVIGAGAVGTSVAYELGRRGFDVTVLDRKPEASNVGAFWDGGHVPSRAMTTPLLWSTWLKHETPLAMFTDLVYVRWFSLAIFSLWEPSETSKHMNQLLKYSRAVKDEIDGPLTPRRRYGTHYVSSGTVDDQAYSEGSHTWTNNLKKKAKEEFNVKFVHDIAVERLSIRVMFGKEFCKNIVASRRDGSVEHFLADRIVVAAGHGSSQLLYPAYRVPVYPVAGYTMQFTARDSTTKQLPPDVGTVLLNSGLLIKNDGGNRWRVSGLHSLNPKWEALYDVEYIKTMFDKHLKRYPEYTFEKLADLTKGYSVFRSVRGASADNLPVIGRLGKNLNLYACFGHGDNDFACASGSARVLVDLMVGERAKVDVMAFSPSRFLPSRVVHPVDDSNVGGEGYLAQFENKLAHFGRWVSWELHRII